MKAIIPAAGLGTRFLPETKAVPKELLPVLDKPVLQYVVEEALAAPSCTGVVVINSLSKQLIEEYFKRDFELEELLNERNKTRAAELIVEAGNLDVDFVYQHEPLGLGHAVFCAEPVTQNEPFYVLLGDVIVPDQTILPKLHEVSEAHGGASVIAVVPVEESQVSRFGIIDGTPVAGVTGENDAHEPGAVWKVSGMVEKPAVDQAPTRLAIFGRYLLSPAVMDALQDVEPGVGGEIQLTDALVKVLGEEGFYAVVIDPNEGYDTGTIPNLIAANVKLAQKDSRYAGDLALALQPQDTSAH